LQFSHNFSLTLPYNFRRIEHTVLPMPAVRRT
jgi:hypothetical protein